MQVLVVFAIGLLTLGMLASFNDTNKAICDAPGYNNRATYMCHCPKLTPIALDFLTTNNMRMPSCEGHARFVEYPCELIGIWFMSLMLAPIQLVKIIFG